jgi:hypothetical protein
MINPNLCADALYEMIIKCKEQLKIVDVEWIREDIRQTLKCLQRRYDELTKMPWE